MKTAIITTALIGAVLLKPIAKMIDWEWIIIHIELALFYGAWIICLITISIIAITILALVVWNRAVKIK